MEGYKKLIIYQNLSRLRSLVYKSTSSFNKIHIRLVSQMRDAARSAKQNLAEGYMKNTLGDFIRSVEISRGH